MRIRKQKDQGTFLSAETAFEGRLVFSGKLEINGQFRGRIASSGSLTIGRDAAVEANVHVGDIGIHGRIDGNVLADRCIEIFEDGRVYGDIQAPRIILHEGGLFEGTCITQAVTEAAEGAVTCEAPLAQGL